MVFFKKEYLLSVCLLLMGISMISQKATAQTTEKDVKTKVEAEAASVLAGHVVDKASQEAVSGAEVKVGGEMAATTNSRGDFFVESLKPGLHKVTVEAEGYEKWTKDISIAEEGKKIEVKLVAAEE